jgi:hypothetical protein
MSINLRCTRSSCRKRHTVRAGQRIPSYPRCGGHLSHDPEPRRRSRRDTCTCDQLPYPHRRGTNFCTYGPQLDEEELRSHLRRLQRTTRY